MPKHGKNFRKAVQECDTQERYSVVEAVEMRSQILNVVHHFMNLTGPGCILNHTGKLK